MPRKRQPRPGSPAVGAPGDGTPHLDVALRFRHFLEACSLDRDTFVDRVDGAIEARTLYPILNGTRRPSRALAVLIERTWGFRAGYLLDGEEPAWVDTAAPATGPPRPATAGCDRPAAAAGGPELTEFESDLIEFVRRSFDNVHSMKLDLERGLLWERLFTRTQALLASLDATGVAAGPSAAGVGAVFDDCMRAAAAFEQYTVAMQRRRTLQLTLVYFNAYLAPGAPASTGATTRSARSARSARSHATAALRSAEQRLQECEDALVRILGLPSPLAMLDPDPDRAFEALAAIVASAVPA